jgi:hypothetical protein
MSNADIEEAFEQCDGELDARYISILHLALPVL